jgi:hypothetical protein
MSEEIEPEGFKYESRQNGLRQQLKLNLPVVSDLFLTKALAGQKENYGQNKKKLKKI